MAQQFKKGDDPRRNLKGRPPGKKNKATEELRDLVKSFLFEKHLEIRTIWGRLEPKEKMMAYEKLLKMVLPPPQDELMKLSDEDLDRIIQKLKDERLRVV